METVKVAKVPHIKPGYKMQYLEPAAFEDASNAFQDFIRHCGNIAEAIQSDTITLQEFQDGLEKNYSPAVLQEVRRAYTRRTGNTLILSTRTVREFKILERRIKGEF